jgi:RNA polymerase sporulation-specific sigma factor
LAAEVGTGVEELAAAVESEAEVESLNKTIYQSDGNEIHLIDRIEESGREDEEIIDRLALHKLIRELEPKERQIIVMRYYMNKTQTQIAGELGISQVQVSRLEKRILASMRKKID